ncbi:flagellar biosynthetic protein FliO [Sporosarcina koreensis]|uniref:flagellar biosynthetic protein FliO n=1 Tax=Sporosarcina koreensis TaxID=334735 RepID=UPI0006950293|nr:flagellar biosynthetic protein FliO [Sporosarcina koreensis]
MKKHSADPFFRTKATLFLIICLAVVLAAGIPSEVAHAEKDTSVTDYLKKNKKEDKGKEPVKAEQPPAGEESPADAPAVGLSVWDYVKTGLALLFVIALIYGLVRLVNARNRISQNGKLMKNMGGLSLGQQKSVQLIEIGGRFYLIGVGEDVRLLKELTDPEEIEQLTAYYEQEADTVQHSPILGLLERLKAGKQNPYQKQEDPGNFGNVFKTKLTEIENERKRKLNQLTEKERNRND